MPTESGLPYVADARHGRVETRRRSARLRAHLLSGLAVLAGFLAAPSAQAAPPSAAVGHHLTAEQWREDLRYLVDQIQKVHPHPFHHVAQPQFAAAVSSLDSE